jgi:Tfp pilus assembly protein PilO
MKLKNREKMLIVFAGIAAALWVFVTFYYAPQGRKIRALKADLKAVDLKSEESVLVTKGVETLEAEVLRQEEALKRLSERTMRGEEFRTFLKHLAKESDPPLMKVISLTPLEENLPPPQGKKESSGPQYKRVTVQVVLHSTYAKLEAYLKGIEGLPFLINVDNIHVERVEEVHPLLKVTIGLSMYVSSQ